MNGTGDNEYLTEQETGKYLGVAPATLRRWRAAGQGPLFFRMSTRYIRYMRKDLDKWIQEKREEEAQRIQAKRDSQQAAKERLRRR